MRPHRGEQQLHLPGHWPHPESVRRGYQQMPAPGGEATGPGHSSGLLSCSREPPPLTSTGRLGATFPRPTTPRACRCVQCSTHKDCADRGWLCHLCLTNPNRPGVKICTPSSESNGATCTTGICRSGTCLVSCAACVLNSQHRGTDSI